jgi:hypothetical protein
VQGACGRQDGPAHRRKPADEEASGAPQDVMLGLEPGDEKLAVVAPHAAKTHEGVHLVEVAAHRLGHPLESVHQRIGGNAE